MVVENDTNTNGKLDELYYKYITNITRSKYEKHENIVKIWKYVRKR